MYLVGYGVHSSAWQVRLPAAEFLLLNHYGPSSTIRTILDILYEILHDINGFRRFQKPVSKITVKLNEYLGTVEDIFRYHTKSLIDTCFLRC